MAASTSESVESSVLSASEEKTNGTRLARLLIDGGTHTLKRFFNTFHAPEKLKDALNNFKPKLQKLKIPQSQWELLFPSSSDPDSGKFDVTLLHLLLREICNLTAPAKGWHDLPAEDDDSPEASIVRIKWVRNLLSHRHSTGISNNDFEHYWSMISSSIKSLELRSLQKELDRLKNDPIDHDTQRNVNERVEKWKSLEMEQEDDIELSSCIPDEGSQVFGRTNEIKQVKEYVLGGTGVVLITGGPGFGKTTIAKEAARALDQAECAIKVFFCSIVCKTTVNDVATEMILACGKNKAHLPENPKLWLQKWSSQCGKEKVVFVLDNADGILDSKEQDTFLRLLEEMRKLSRQNVAFVITSRKAFTNPNWQMREVKLGFLPLTAAKCVLLSRVPNNEMRCRFSKVDRLVELCGYVPLALCIAGSLLSDFDENELIQKLQDKPLDVLEDEFSPGTPSVENAIKTSVDNLKEVDKQGLVLLAAFPGPFNRDAAEDILRGCPELNSPIEKILRSLKLRSLVECSFVENPQRYQIHLLVKAYAVKMGQNTYPQLSSLGKKLACSHFISRICKNASLYWSENGCKKSLQCFNEERNNFEYFLELFISLMNCPDSDIEVGSSAFLNDFPQKCMYLEMCLLPSAYKKLLERLLKCPAANERAVFKVELLCLIGHESRKEHGHHDEYKTYMNEAQKTYSDNRSKFQSRALSEVLFINSYARFLSEQNSQTGPKEQYEIALEVCKEKLGSGHPETATTLLFAGRNAKRRKDYNKAEQMLNEALDSFQKSLGDHFMTSQTLKDLADFYFFLGEPKSDEAKQYYEEALQMMEHLGLDNHKECVFLTLKNFGSYQTSCGNHEEALRLLLRAKQIADRELEEDHKWKVMVLTALAFVYEDNGEEERAVESMKQGLQMWSRIKGPDGQLKDRREIRKFLDSRPDISQKNSFHEILCYDK